MIAHNICKGCKWNVYPECRGTIMENGRYMNIEKLRSTFQCGQKDFNEVNDLSFKKKTKVEELEARIKILEEVK